MKHRLLLLITLLSFSIAKAGHDHTLQNTLNGNQNYHYTANSHITLLPGFKAEPINGHEIMLDIDAYRIFPPESGITGGASQNNTGGVVGSLGGNVDVSLCGGATYSIPIDLPNGLGGMKPQLSICYNSQSKNELLGWGWDLTGLSSITRTGKTPYFDESTTAVDYINDRFCLDGVRLLNTDVGPYGGHGTSYRTEQDQLSKIVSYHETGINGPSYFKIYTADGRILYYGNSDDSKVLMDQQNHVGAWLLNRTEDRNGNSIEYHYISGQNSYRLDHIAYSGNTNDMIAPAFTVEFQYGNREDIEISIVGKQFCRMDKILNKIVVRNGNSEMYSYQFIYQKPKPQNGLPYHMLTEVRFHSGQEHLNPTRIQWSSNNYNAITGNDLKIQVNTGSVSDAFLNAIKYSGDFNGDGYTDVIALQPNNQGEFPTAKLFINKGLNGPLEFEYVTSFTMKSNATWIQVADFDGDGLDDVLVSNRSRRLFFLPDQIDAEIYLCRRSPSGSIFFRKYTTPPCYISRYAIDAHLVGNFLGNGKNVILIQTATESGKALKKSQIYSYNEDADEFQLFQFPETLNDTRLYAADYDGDGITEILYKKSNNNTSIVKITECDDTFHYTEIYNGTIENWDDCFTGDFNGDGLTDVLFYTSEGSHPWKIHLSQGAKFSSDGYYLPDNFPYSSPGNYMFSLDQPHHSSQYIKIGDLDGNGCSDLALFKDNFFYVFYGPLKETGENAPFTNCHKINISAFGLYDNMGVCLGNFLGQERLSFLGHVTLSKLPSMRLRHEVKTITDGMGRKTDFTYDYLSPNLNNPSNNDFYKLNGTGLDHLHKTYCIAVPMRGLKRVTTYNVKGKPIETRCFYEDALLHKDGKGFLGFSKTRQDDYCDGQLQKSAQKYYDITYNNDAIHLSLEHEEVLDHNGQLMARSEYSNQLYSHIRNGKVFILIADKSNEEYDVTQPDKLIKKEIFFSEIDRHCNQIYKYDDVISVVSQTKGTTTHSNYQLASSCEFQEITQNTFFPNNLTTWLINKPKTITKISHREGNYDDVYHHQVFSYYTNKPYLVKSILDLPNDGSHPEDRLAKKTILQYDPVGNITVRTFSTPNDTLAARTERFEYSKTYGRRLITKYYDAMGQASTYTYDPVYNYRSSVTDCNGLQTVFEQDPLGTTCLTYFPDGTESCQAIRWASNSYYQWEKKSGQETKINTYAYTGDPIGTKSYDIQGKLVFTNIEYDHLGRIFKKSLPHGLNNDIYFLQYQYDNHNRLVRIDHADGSYETLQYGENSKSTSFVATDGSIQNESKTFNVMGWVVRSTDAEGNSVVYDYRADGKPISAQVEGYGETRIEMRYDGLGNRIMLSDPNYGQSIYEYNAFNEVIREVSPKMDETSYCYDLLGRATVRTELEHQNKTQETTRWVYGTTPGKRGLLTSVISPNHTINYDYDPLSRLTRITEALCGQAYHTSYTYDSASRIAETTYPSDYTVNYSYTSEGYLRSILDEKGTTLWKILETNSVMQPTKFITANGFVTQNSYDDQTGRLLSIRTTHNDKVIQDYTYNYDNFANMTYRKDLTNGLEEHFEYDLLNRLIGVDSQRGTSTFNYDPLGRMISKTDPDGTIFSDADYSGPKPHAIKSVKAPHNVFPQERMDIEYTVFNKVKTITEGCNSIQFDYGYNHQRIRSTENFDNATRIKTYVNGCEYIEDPDGSRIWTFLSCPSGTFAVVETFQDTSKLYFIHKDHLGSWNVVSDSDGHIEQDVRFDAWGCCKDSNHLMFDRGFTGHEHLKGMNLINMNGRLYDSTTSSMISPDDNIQMPDFTQNLNRYSYCLNNPLAYTDPDGNSAIEVLLFYFLFCTDFGYECQKYLCSAALHFDIHLSKTQLGVGFDISLGWPKTWAVSFRGHFGATLYWSFYDNSFKGLETRIGGEMCILGYVGYSGTKFTQDNIKQTTNSIILGNCLCNFTYENDYMFNLSKYIPCVPAADNGDRYRSAAARFRFGPFSVGVNLFTGDPGVDHNVRRTFNDPDRDGRETYTISANGDDPDKFRAGIFYVGIGPFKIGSNSEKVRDCFQNKFAHDWLCKGDSPYFKVLDRPSSLYFYFGTETGGTLW